MNSCENNPQEILLHICCAPDGTVPTIDLKSQGWNVRGFFYGNNIHPIEEYKKRLEAIKILSDKNSVDIIIQEYDPEKWLDETKGLEHEPEGGLRCEKCFELQFEAAAREAVKLGIKILCTTLTISPHKNVNKIFEIGKAIAKKYDLEWLNIIWRKNNGFLRSTKLSREMGLYRQNYCGCFFSMRESF